MTFLSRLGSPRYPHRGGVPAEFESCKKKWPGAVSNAPGLFETIIPVGSLERGKIL
jgi:hypothetical protein